MQDDVEKRLHNILKQMNRDQLQPHMIMLLKIAEALVVARKGITLTTENPLSHLLTSFDMTYHLERTQTLQIFLSYGQ